MNLTHHFSGIIRDDSMNLGELAEIRIEIQRAFMRCSILTGDRDKLLDAVEARRKQILNPDVPRFIDTKSKQKEMF
tara:strand:+ start:689 stop:916 length:228 start_codon:yes stop_codon:yes gene_type:complete